MMKTNAKARETLRVFVALPLPEEAVEELAALARRSRSAMPRGAVRWVRPEQMHLTLQFLGNVAADRIAALQADLAAACRDAPPFPLELAAPGAFPNARHPRVLWVGLGGDLERLGALQTRVAAACAPFLPAPERGRFHPHLTLGRVKDDARAVGDAWAGCPAPRAWRWRAGEVRLIQSVLQPAGAVHATLAAFPLSPSPAA
jgi:2'-5' RNA ligase